MFSFFIAIFSSVLETWLDFKYVCACIHWLTLRVFTDYLLCAHPTRWTKPIASFLLELIFRGRNRHEIIMWPKWNNKCERHRQEMWLMLEMWKCLQQPPGRGPWDGKVSLRPPRRGRWRNSLSEEGNALAKAVSRSTYQRSHWWQRARWQGHEILKLGASLGWQWSP